MKQFTTPTIGVTVEDWEEVTAAEVLAAADKILLTVSDGIKEVNLEPAKTVENVLYFDLSEQDTGMLEAGNLSMELTLKTGDKLMKSKTFKAKLEESVRNEVFN